MSARSFSTSGVARTRAVLAIAIGVVAAAVLIVSGTQRGAVKHAFDEGHATSRALVSILDQQVALHGYAISGDETFVADYLRSGRRFDGAIAELRALARDDSARETVDAMALAARDWQRLARRGIGRLRRGGRQVPGSPARRSETFDRFRGIAETFDAELTAERNRRLERAGLVAVVAIVGLALVFAAFGYVVVGRQARAARRRRAQEREYRRTQSEFAAAMQVMRDEPEAHNLVKQHLERTIPGSEIVVLNRNNSDNRLAPATGIADDSALAERLANAEPEACLAVRLGREYDGGGDVAPLLQCELCGTTASEIVCTPSLVGGEVIGSVLVRGQRRLGHEERSRIADSVSQAAPVLANLRNLAIAETRASTDALTGLANARTCRDTLRRMVAHAGRAVSPLAAVLLDLDHFKQINDRFGHGVGDDVLAAVGEVLRSSLRAGDFVGRYGGEEFLLLLPSTDQDGAVAVAEKVRTAIAALQLTQIDIRVTASIGVAAYPFDALDGDDLVRVADRALYAAKADGRNRVERTASHATRSAAASTI